MGCVAAPSHDVGGAAIGRFIERVVPDDFGARRVTGNLVNLLGLVNHLGVLRCGLKQGCLVKTVIPHGLRVAVAFHEFLAC